MKRPKKIKRYCKFCRKHTEQEVSVAKKRERGSLKKGSLRRAKKRGLTRGYGNKGRWGSKPAISKFNRTGAKISKKPDLRFKCKTCNKTTTQAQGMRAKKVEII
ncbi:MAG: 50S ribosomal protein L44e [Nanoarchaeota archaeon]